MVRPMLMKHAIAIVLAVSSSGVARADAPAACTATVVQAIDKAFPKASIASCKLEHEKGRDQYEVKATKADGAKIEVDVGTDGKILLVEEKIPVDKIPPAVAKAFAAKYPTAKVETAERQTPATGTPTYELAFASEKGRKEATFTADGKFIDEE